MLENIEELYEMILSGETVTTHDENIYKELSEKLSTNGVDFVSGDIDPMFPDEPYYIELN